MYLMAKASKQIDRTNNFRKIDSRSDHRSGYFYAETRSLLHQPPRSYNMAPQRPVPAHGSLKTQP